MRSDLARSKSSCGFSAGTKAGQGQVRGRGHRDNQIRFFTIAQVAEGVGVSSRTVRRWLQAGDLVAYRIGGVVRIAERDLNAFLALHREV
jgi:excisionase family DNA binding protein